MQSGVIYALIARSLTFFLVTLSGKKVILIRLWSPLVQIISDNGISKVWQDGDWIYKQQPKYNTDSEIWCLEQLYPHGIVPYAQRHDLEVIRLEFLQRTPITDPVLVMGQYKRVLLTLRHVGIRHGDLTEPNVIISHNQIYLLDFSESRLLCDPRPEKRPEGDAYWLKKTLEELCK